MVATEKAKHFLNRADAVEFTTNNGNNDDNNDTCRTTSGQSESIIETDEAEWHLWEKRGDPVLHISLRKWADVLVIAPLSANTLAKMAAGLCDNLLTSVFRAWEFRAGKPVVVAPAMNTEMWDHPFTEKHLQAIKELGSVTVVEPSVKTLACGDTGQGALAALPDIIDAVEEALRLYDDINSKG